jgi:hypothetical protein
VLFFIKRNDFKDFCWLSKNIMSCPSTFNQYFSQSVKNLFCSI